MIMLRKSEDRGHFDHGWLNTHHTFSFGSYRDPNHMNFRTLRVMNEDRVQAGAGFGEHGHSNMEIISYVLDGALEHRDSMGNGSVLTPGTFQRMSAGTGVRHSEFNHAQDADLHFYQIWILPETQNIPPSYEERHFDPQDQRNQWILAASRDARDDSMKIHQDALLYLARLDVDQELSHALASDRHAWLQCLRGAVQLGDHKLAAGDGAAVSEETSLSVRAIENSEVLLFDLA